MAPLIIWLQPSQVSPLVAAGDLSTVGDGEANLFTEFRTMEIRCGYQLHVEARSVRSWLGGSSAARSAGVSGDSAASFVLECVDLLVVRRIFQLEFRLIEPQPTPSQFLVRPLQQQVRPVPQNQMQMVIERHPPRTEVIGRIYSEGRPHLRFDRAVF